MKNPIVFFAISFFFISANTTQIAKILSSFAIVSAWGYFLYIGVIDPKGGINMLWPLFGMSNQMLAGIALTLATMIILKSKNKKYFFITAIPLVALLVIITSAVVEKVFSPDVKIGFLAMANMLEMKINSGLITNLDEISLTKKMIFNQKLVSFLAISFMLILYIVVIDAIRSYFKNYHKKS